jgi:Bacterial Ig-like domain (group 3)/FG-GAP-like repeat
MSLSSRFLRLALCSLLWMLPSAGISQNPQFTVPEVYPTGGRLANLLPGSFQPQSGETDLFYINAFTTTGTTFQVNVGELLNHSGFTNLAENQINFSAVLGVSAAIADFDNDGISDYAFALSPILAGATDLCIYYGTGAGLSGPAYSGGINSDAYPPTGGKNACMSFPIQGPDLPNFSAIAAAPFKTALTPQLIVEDSNNNYIYILANTGTDATNGVLSNVTLKSAIPIPPADGAGPIYTGDFNGDGNTDFIVNNQAGNAATIYFGNGDGTFQAPKRLTFDKNVHSMLLHDMDGDGIQDIVVEGDNGVIEIFKGNHSIANPFGPLVGGTSAGVDGLSGNGGHLAAIGKLGTDTILDILTTTPIGLSVLQGQGGLTYKLKGIYNVGPGRSSFVLADFNNDGIPDLAVDSPEGVAIVHGKPDASFDTSPAYPAGQPALNATIADFNRDGKPDVVAATGATQAQVFLGNGDGSFTPQPTPTNALPSPNPTLWSTILTGDFDGDGRQDLLYSLTGLPLPTPGANAGSGLYLQYGNGDGTFTAPVAISPQAVGAQSLTNFYGESAVGDFNGDGITDIANLDADYYNTLLSQGTGPFRLTLNYAEDANLNDSDDLDSFSQVAAGFFSPGRTTMPDLVFQDDANITPYVSNGGGTFTAMANLSGTPSVSQLYGGTILIADIDGDGFGDIIIPYHNLGSSPANPSPDAANQLYIWYGNGDTFQPPQITPLSRNYYLAAIADMNSDGRPDLILSDGYLVSILYNQGNHTFGSEQHFLAGQGINSISLADVNGDGSLDLIVSNGGATISDAVVIGGKTNASISLTPNPDVNTGGITVLLNNVRTKPVTGTLTASPEPTQYQAAFTLTATLTPTPGVQAPTGTVTFSIDGTQVGNPVPVVPGAVISTATYVVPASNAFQGGSHTLEATYSGDAFNSTYNLFDTHAIQGSSTTTTLHLCVGPTPACPSNGLIDPGYTPMLMMYFGQTFNGTAGANDTDGTPLTGTIAFNDAYNGAPPVLLCTLAADIVGASCPPDVGVTVGTSVGINVFTAVYSGDPLHTTSTSPTVTITVLPDTNTANLTGAPNPSPQGQPVTFTATFTGNAAAPTGTATFFESFPPTALVQQLGTATLVPGSGFTSTATFTTSALPIGTDTINVNYAATMNFAAASATTTETITPVLATTTRLTSSLNPSLVGQSVIFTAAVSTAVGTPIPTGTVTFLDGTATIGTGPLINGAATFSTSTLTAGSHTITATASGDSATAPSTSASLTQIVNPLPPPGSVNFSITVTPSPVTIGVGNAATLTVTVTPLNGFTQAVTLSCANLPTESACTFLNPAIPVGGGSTTVLLTTMAPHSCGATQPYFTGSSSNPKIIPFALPALAGLAIIFLPGRRRWLRALIAIAAIATAMQITGCGNCTDLGTRPNTYTIHITGAASGTSEVESTPVTMNVTILKQ